MNYHQLFFKQANKKQKCITGIIFSLQTHNCLYTERVFFLSVNSRSIIISSSYADDTTLFIKGNNLSIRD